MSGFRMIRDPDAPTLTRLQLSRRHHASDEKRLSAMTAQLRRATAEELGEEFLRRCDEVAREARKT